MKLHKNKKGFELQNLYGFVLMLILIALILGVGVLVIDKMSTTVYITSTVENESFVTPANQSTVQLDRLPIRKFAYAKNATGTTLNGTLYSINMTFGILRMINNETDTCREGQTCYAFYDWDDYGSAANIAFNASRDAITPIASTWLTLIVTIVVLAIILTIVIRSFGQKRD